MHFRILHEDSHLIAIDKPAGFHVHAPEELSLKQRLQRIRDALCEGLIERDIPIRLALLAALAGEHVLLIGPPGTAKSELARRLRLAFTGQTYFERLLTRFSVPL